MIRRGYVCSGFFAFRTPLLPFSTLDHRPDGAPRDETPEPARRRLSAWLGDARVREALFLASPALDERVPAWLTAPDDPATRGVQHALVKYRARMAARATPFGLFGATSVGLVADRTDLTVPALDRARRHTRLDMDWLSVAIERLAADPGLRAELPFEPNTSLYEAGDALRYAEARLDQRARSYFLVHVEAHDALRAALAAARGGATLDAVADALAARGVPRDDARAFVDELADAQLLIPVLGPAVTGEGALADLIARLESRPAGRGAAAALERVRDTLATFDAGEPVAPERYRALAADLSALAPADPTRLVQVDLSRPAEGATLAASTVDELLGALEVMHALFGAGREDALREFRRRFDERWGERELPLAHVLDEEIGIGFAPSHEPGVDPSPLLAGLPFPPSRGAGTTAWPERFERLAWKLAEATATGAHELVLDDDDVRAMRADAPPMADAIHVMATLLEPDEPAGPRAVFENAAGPSGVRLLGRFCHADPALRTHVEAHLRAEEALRPDVTHFEIVHLNEGRTGNILARPVLREFELAWLGASGAPPDRTLRADDLWVSVRDERVVLRSRTLDREVRPRLTSAHNTALRSVPLYRFLAALQAEGVVEGVMWNWGPHARQPRLPRVRWRRIVLARAQWTARQADVDALAKGTADARIERVQAWRRARGVPRWAGLADGDNVLPVDFDDPLSADAFLDAVESRDGFTLVELFPGGRPDVVVSPAGRHVNEVIVPLVRREAPARTARPEPVELPDAADAWSFAPGSEWLYAKIYSGAAVADRVLRDVVAPVVERALASGAARGWFFVRYADPDPHVRVRWRGVPARLLAETLPDLHARLEPLRRTGLVDRAQLDTYLREMRRYGGPGAIERCEALFRHDSDAALELIAALPGDRGLDARWRLTLRGMHQQLEDLGLDLAARHALAGTLVAFYGAEFRVDSALRQKTMERFRRERAALDRLLFEPVRDDHPLAAACAAQDRHRVAAAPVWAALRERLVAGSLGVTRDELAASLLHMHANRLLRSSARAQELVLAYFLESLCASRRARRES